ncbi:unnamed protein product [Lactuca saligna]|uniref:Wound-responsive family protein n=1 Tax=Lactuca saligna TaxID=75948 RepID=A0AA35YKC5_LACSI|nr:unnamed protein product [Lactuca saligna]
MSFRSRAWMVAGAVGVVEALKDQGFARWNTTIRTIQHHAKSNLRSIAQAKILTSPAAMASSKDMEEKAKQSEESLRKVMLYIEILDLDSKCLEIFQANQSMKGLVGGIAQKRAPTTTRSRYSTWPQYMKFKKPVGSLLVGIDHDSSPDSSLQEGHMNASSYGHVLLPQNHHISTPKPHPNSINKQVFPHLLISSENRNTTSLLLITRIHSFSLTK